jgi:hypothetical protein
MVAPDRSHGKAPRGHPGVSSWSAARDNVRMDGPTMSPRPAPGARDLDAIEVMHDVEHVFVNDSRWWQNASFALPLGGAVVALVVGFAFGSAEATGFGVFLAAVTLLMIPVVLFTWRSTATAIVLTREGAVALHLGRSLHELRWAELRRIDEVNYLGNTRYKLLHGEDEFMTVESEIAGQAALVEAAFELSGLERQSASNGGEA